MNWNDYFYYEDGKLYWKVDKKKAKAGDLVGWKKPNGYVQMKLNYKKYYLHRVLWEMHYGEIPEGIQIDHINGVRDDNRIENLRCASATENMRNRSKSKRGFPGVTGVNYNKRDSLWHAMIGDGKRNISLGHFRSFVSACEARIVAEVNLGYHVNHGKREIVY